MFAAKVETLPGLTRALTDATKAANQLVSAGIPTVIEVREGHKKRTADQNSLIYAAYNDIAKQLGDRTPLDVRKESKLHLGIPILRTEDAEYRERYDKLIRHRFSYEEKLELMADWPVTSLMNTNQLSQYFEAMIEYWSKRGIVIKTPD